MAEARRPAPATAPPPAARRHVSHIRPLPWADNDARLAERSAPYVLRFGVPHCLAAQAALGGRAPWDVRAQPKRVRRRVRPAFPLGMPQERHEHLVFAIGVSERSDRAAAPLAFQCYLHWRADFDELARHGRLNRSRRCSSALRACGPWIAGGRSPARRA